MMFFGWPKICTKYNTFTHGSRRAEKYKQNIDKDNNVLFLIGPHSGVLAVASVAVAKSVS